MVKVKVAASAIADLLPAAAVRIDIGRTPSGTGFFVAPGQVLTCAHVIEPATLGSPATSQAIHVWDSRGRGYEVTAAPATDPNADLAWLRLPTAPVDVPMALLFRDASQGDELLAYGFPAGKPEGVPVTFEAEGFTGGSLPLIKFKEGQVQPGMSGAPLLNLRTGAVCGVLRRTRDEQQALGGYGITVDAIERVGFYRDLHKHVTAAHRAKSPWLERLAVEQRRLVRSVVAFEPSLAVEFVINIVQWDDCWRVDATVYPQGVCVGPVAVDLNDVRMEVARLFRAWKSQRRIDDADQARLLGRMLYRAVVPQVLADELERYIFDSPDTRVNISLHFAKGTAPDLIHLPWEQLYVVPGRESRAGVAIGMQDQATLTRVLTPHPLECEPPTASPLKVLLVVAPLPYGSPKANGDGSCPPGTKEVSAKVHELLSTRDQIEVDLKAAISAEQLADVLSENRFTVVHYVGYARYHGNADELALDDGYGNVAWLGSEDFADLLNAPPTRLVVLQAATGPSDFIPGDLTVLAEQLLRTGVEAVVASQFPTPELGAAAKFVELLYSHLANGSSLRAAVQRVRKGLRVKPWTQPALFAQFPGDLRLLAPASASLLEARPWSARG